MATGLFTFTGVAGTLLTAYVENGYSWNKVTGTGAALMALDASGAALKSAGTTGNAIFRNSVSPAPVATGTDTHMDVQFSGAGAWNAFGTAANITDGSSTNTLSLASANATTILLYTSNNAVSTTTIRASYSDALLSGNVYKWFHAVRSNKQIVFVNGHALETVFVAGTGSDTGLFSNGGTTDDTTPVHLDNYHTGPAGFRLPAPTAVRVLGALTDSNGQGYTHTNGTVTSLIHQLQLQMQATSGVEVAIVTGNKAQSPVGMSGATSADMRGDATSSSACLTAGTVTTNHAYRMLAYCRMWNATHVLLWFGTNDCKATAPSTYKADYKANITNTEAFFRNPPDGGAPIVCILCDVGDITANTGSWDAQTTTRLQDIWDANNELCAAIPTLLRGPNHTQLFSGVALGPDGLHYPSAGSATIATNAAPYINALLPALAPVTHPVSNIQYSLESGKLKITWTATTDSPSYHDIYFTRGGVRSKVGTVSGTATNYTDSTTGAFPTLLEVIPGNASGDGPSASKSIAGTGTGGSDLAYTFTPATPTDDATDLATVADGLFRNQAGIEMVIFEGDGTNTPRPLMCLSGQVTPARIKRVCKTGRDTSSPVYAANIKS